METQDIGNPILPAAGVAGATQRTVVLVLLREDTMATGPQTLSNGEEGSQLSDNPGDFNARLGPEDAPFTYHTNTNRNGEHLAALLTERRLLAANTLFRKRMGKRWTFQDRATSMRRQLDYILVRRKWRKSILNAESYSTFDSVGSDHRVVAARLRLSLRVPRRPRARPDWEAFAGSPELQANYTAEVRGRLHLLAEEGEPTTLRGGSSPPAKRQPGNGYRRRGDIEPP
ncbi:hypothetical protein AAFF_G00120390 [Aldrovandia affinis]|uniref:Endonuclease/exonuclease/phosphatase domain-containing protein n=1 Tax=Aldrovandia affinis TaxID=143900 RepID=A0AAD7RUP5_9TELE|nr:hypothetical protein AAFF_G00120390 [Aldrovandia affinis]